MFLGVSSLGEDKSDHVQRTTANGEGPVIQTPIKSPKSGLTLLG
jgi:hypothetical protein